MNNTNVNYDYYFALGYETKEQIDLFIKYNPPRTAEEIAVSSLHSHTDSLYSRSAVATESGTHGAGHTTNGSSGFGYEIEMLAPPAATNLLNKFQLKIPQNSVQTKNIFMKNILSLLLLTCIMHQVHAQIQWQHCYGGTAYEECHAIRNTFDGGYILTGYASSSDGDVSGCHGGGDFWVVKIATTGSMEWQRCYGGSNDEEAYDIQQTTDSGYIVVGNTNSNDGEVTGNHGGYDVWVIKISSSGALQWQKCLGGSGYDGAGSIGQTADGGYIFAGITNSNDGNVSGNHGYYDVWAVKLTNTGSITWAKTYGGSSWDGACTVQQTYDGGYIIGGGSTSNNGDVTGHHGDTTQPDFWVVKLSTTGSIEWQKSLGGSDYDPGSFAIQTRDSGYIVCGATGSVDGDVTGHIGSCYTCGPYGLNGWVVKLSQSGAIQWDKCIYVCGDDELNSIMQTTDGRYVVAGTTCWNIYGNGSAIYFKLSDTGHIDWMTSCGGIATGPDHFSSIAPTSDGFGIAAGYTASTDGDVSGNHGQTDYWVVKFAHPTEAEVVVNNNKLLLNPSPADNYLSISAPYIITSIVITDIMGRVVYSNYEISIMNYILNTCNWMHGMYFVKVNGLEIGKIVKE